MNGVDLDKVRVALFYAFTSYPYASVERVLDTYFTLWFWENPNLDVVRELMFQNEENLKIRVDRIHGYVVLDLGFSSDTVRLLFIVIRVSNYVEDIMDEFYGNTKEALLSYI